MKKRRNRKNLEETANWNIQSWNDVRANPRHLTFYNRGMDRDSVQIFVSWALPGPGETFQMNYM